MRSRIARIRTECAIALALLFGAATASAQPVESVTVDGTDSGAINRFVQAAVTPTHTIGKVARWEIPLCPYALGLPDNIISRVVQRVKDVAFQVGARVDNSAACKPNIVIAFTSTPQDLLDNIRKDHAPWLGYHVGVRELDRLATVTRPIQAWYSTAIIDLQGRRQSDGGHLNDRNGPGLRITAPCILIGGGGRAPGNGGTGNGFRDPNALCTVWLPDAIKTTVEASRLADGLRATFDRVTIVANPPTVPASMSAIEDYIAVLALAQINSLDKCQALPSITNLLVSGCAQPGAITGNDLSYLRAIYGADAEGPPAVQKNEIARRMERGIAGR